MKIFNFASTILAAPFLAVVAVDTHLEEAKAIFDMVSGVEDGFVNPKLELRRATPGDPTSPMGVYATQDIESGEDLIKVPYSVVIENELHGEPPANLMCGTVYATAEEMRLGAESEIAPYAIYLNSEVNSSIPSTWSSGAQELLLKVIENGKVDPLPPERAVTMITNDWFGRCRGDPNDAIGIRAAVMVLQRADDQLMIPAYDNLNHRNGNWTNANTENEEEQHVTYATKNIKAGDQIYISYNFCEECGNRRMFYGTAEILRDYGFVEAFPQRWHYMEEDFQFDLDQIEDGKYIVTWDRYERPEKDDAKLMEQCRVWFRWEIRRLKRLKNIEIADLKQTDQGIPAHELETLEQFLDANIVAMTAGLESLGPSPEKGSVLTTRADSSWSMDPEDDKSEEKDDDNPNTCKADEDYGGCMAPIDLGPLMANASHYDYLEWEFDDLDYQRSACDNKELMRFIDFEGVEWMQTHYQKLNFMRKEKTDNMCMDLDNIVQICSDYRPQYHEFSTHASGRYVKDVKRIIFIGGGDSMLLHEALKYPNLELVVGLEIDQTVVRKSFKYFHTQPHFNDERVEWWFGDATKSLLLLPEDYWSSFDLVLVDLSETVMSFSVTSELDVFDALALLLNPQGVMVKNEHYHEKFAALFDYSAEINYESPVVCNQVMVFGSNNVDFFRDPVYDHGVETLLYESLHTPENRYDLMHGYRKNIAPPEKCNVAPPAEKTTQGTAAGILEVVNAEGCSVELDESIVDIIKKAAENEGFKPISQPVFEDSVGFVVLEEGFIGARIVPEEKYVGFDVNLWGMSSKIKSLRKALAEAVGSSDTSAYKVVVGGMYGSSTWREDEKIQGPKMKQLRNCEPDIVAEGTMDEKTASAIAIEEIVPVTLKTTVAAVVCGPEEEECVGYDALKKASGVTHIFPVYDCSDASGFECEKQVAATIVEQLRPGKKLNLLVMDGSSSLAMHQVISSILETDILQTYFEDHNVVVSWMADSENEIFRREFLDRYRKIVHLEPGSRAEIVLKAEGKSYELGLVSSKNDRSVYEYEQLQERIKNRLSSSGVQVEVRNIHGALFKYMPDWDPKTFRHEEYDSKPGREQFKAQKPLGRQNVYQFVKAAGVEGELDLDSEKVADILITALATVRIDATSLKRYNDVGDGIMILTLSSKGYVTLVWDGREHISVNFFTIQEAIGMPERFTKAFLKASGNKLQVGLRDDQPRGTNRVINFPSDMDPNHKFTTNPPNKFHH